MSYQWNETYNAICATEWISIEIKKQWKIVCALIPIASVALDSIALYKTEWFSETKQGWNYTLMNHEKNIVHTIYPIK